ARDGDGEQEGERLRESEGDDRDSRNNRNINGESDGDGDSSEGSSSGRSTKDRRASGGGAQRGSRRKTPRVSLQSSAAGKRSKGRDKPAGSSGRSNGAQLISGEAFPGRVMNGTQLTLVEASGIAVTWQVLFGAPVVEALQRLSLDLSHPVLPAATGPLYLQL
ncbi:unnamed protein product, partial [Closterium sp. NIES-64]